MQFQQPVQASQSQLSLFEAFIAQPRAVRAKEKTESSRILEQDAFSELTLRGAAGNCLFLLAPVLRELSQGDAGRWLTLVAPPASLTQGWLRDAGLNRERILLLQPRPGQDVTELTCEALRLGRSHTVISWFNQMDQATRRKLLQAASLGNAQSLNIRLG
ncbi:SOS-induced cell division inhibitor SulA [Azotobacter bryophylli]|jgi:cell division inhibitor SulA|uniref:SOS-induced cell division inhibitor SulA n=1 Tax=Azotobacter bryophylli TaxID=1986537 RepID=A0ABV7AWA9_9GAMM